ncbi:MAG: AmmeMemoRadiSam system protein B [Acidobacteriota bacterium]
MGLIRKTSVWIACFLFLGLPLLLFTQPVRKAVWAGQFYPENPQQLRSLIEGWYVRIAPSSENKHIRVLFAPHAAYIYSGEVAAIAYRQVQGAAFTTIIIIAPAHHFGFRGASVFPAGEYETPLGRVEVDEKTANFIKKTTGFSYVSAAHQKEHAIEVQLPFIKIALPEAKIVPIVMGSPERRTIQKLADALHKLPDKENMLVVVSTDLSHYFSKEKARSIDLETQKLVKNLRADAVIRKLERGENFMCGAGPVAAALLYGKKLSKPSVELLSYTDSSEAGGPADRVVGYMAAILYQENSSPPSFSLNRKEKAELLYLAREAMSLYVREKKILNYSTSNSRFNTPRGAFVTLKKNNQLRGCIGFVESGLPLYQSIIQASVYASSRDTRFKPVTPEELESIEVEISVLSPLKKIMGPEWIHVGRHGLVIAKGERNGLLLPQVATENHWDRETFLRQACLKAGLRANAWKTGAEIYTFEALVFAEKDL